MNISVNFNFQHAVKITQKQFDYHLCSIKQTYEELKAHYAYNKHTPITGGLCHLHQPIHTPKNMKYKPRGNKTKSTSSIRIPYFNISFPHSTKENLDRLVVSQIETIQCPSLEKSSESSKTLETAHQIIYGPDDTFHRINITFVRHHYPVNAKKHSYVTFQFCVETSGWETFRTGFLHPFKQLLTEYQADSKSDSKLESTSSIPKNIEIEWIRHCESCSNAHVKDRLSFRSPPCTKKGVLQGLRKSLQLQQKYGVPPKNNRLYGCSSSIRGIETAFYSFQHIPPRQQVIVLPFIHENISKLEKKLVLAHTQLRKENICKHPQTSNRAVSSQEAIDYINMLQQQIQTPTFDAGTYQTILDDINRKMTVNNFLLFWKRALLPFYFTKHLGQPNPLPHQWSIITHSQFIKRIFNFDAEHDDALFPKNLDSYIADYHFNLYRYQKQETFQINELKQGIQSNYFLFGCPLIIETTLIDKIGVGEFEDRMLCV